MKQRELIAIVALKHKVTQAKAKAIYDEIFGLISASLLRGESVGIKYFGTFEPVERAERTIGNLHKTGENLIIKKKKSIKFKASKTIKEKLNG